MELLNFCSEKFGNVRAFLVNNEPWFSGKDVAENLGYKDYKDALKSHVKQIDKQIFKGGQNTAFDIPNRGMTFINLSGIFSLTMQS